MKQIANIKSLLFMGVLMSTSCGGFALAQQIVLQSSEGETYVIEVQPDDKFHDVLGYINHSLEAVESHTLRSRQSEFENALAYASPSNSFRMVVSEENIVVQSQMRKASKSSRNYNAAATEQEKAEIGYIVKTLANNSLLKIKGAESSLKKAGEKVENVHPLQFLLVIFTNEEYKVSMRNLEGRSWVWKSFLEGITRSLGEENTKDNLMQFVPDFSKQLGINPKDILPIMQAGQWEKFVGALIKLVPRNGDSGRYDM